MTPGIQLPVRVKVEDVAHGILNDDIEIRCLDDGQRFVVEVQEHRVGERYALVRGLTVAFPLDEASLRL